MTRSPIGATTLAVILCLGACETPTAQTESPILVTVSGVPVTATVVPLSRVRATLVSVAVTAVIENRGEHDIAVSECAAQLYRQKPYVTVVAEQDCPNPTSRVTLAPGESVTQTYEVRGCRDGDCGYISWNGAIDGRYAFLVGVNVSIPGTVDGVQTFAISRAFEVRQAGNQLF